ncbi:diguanylate cyclase [Planctomicrobium sp. SH527]|uniref:GGDEF domain-containing protein n=1 Tax=Planctomicrobium sp. SH527 TaxID=3448123 RepID=UPI003F5C87A3
MTNIVLAFAASAVGMLRSMLQRPKADAGVSDTSTIRKLTRAIAARQFEIDWLLATRDPNNSPAQSIRLLQQSSPSPASAFACYLSPTGDVVQLSETLQDSLPRLTSAGRLRLSSETPVELKREHQHWSNFRNPAAIPEQSWAFPCGAPGNPTGWIVTSYIPVLTEDQETDRAVLEKLCRATHMPALRGQQSLARRSSRTEFDENQLVRDMFQLRLLADEDFSTPEEMLQEFLSKLAFLSGFDRASLYSRHHQGSSEFQCWTRGGRSISPSLNRLWEVVEQKILQSHVTSHLRVWLTEEDHPALSTDRELTFQSVLIVPMDQARFPGSVLLLTSRSSVSQEKITEELADWAVNFAVHSFHQALDRQQIEYRAQRDCLTDLANRHTFEIEFKNQLKSCQLANQSCSLILIDIDHFKDVNDTFGHSAGDEILRQVADVISRSATQFTNQPKTQIARYGGEEFAVLLPGYELDEAIDIAEQIRKAVESTIMSIPARHVKVTCSIGVSSAPEYSDYDPSTLRQKADMALYGAKRSGRNQVVGDQQLQQNVIAE